MNALIAISRLTDAMDNRNVSLTYNKDGIFLLAKGGCINKTYTADQIINVQVEHYQC